MKFLLGIPVFSQWRQRRSSSTVPGLHFYYSYQWNTTEHTESQITRTSYIQKVHLTLHKRYCKSKLNEETFLATDKSSFNNNKPTFLTTAYPNSWEKSGVGSC